MVRGCAYGNWGEEVGMETSSQTQGRPTCQVDLRGHQMLEKLRRSGQVSPTGTRAVTGEKNTRSHVRTLISRGRHWKEGLSLTMSGVLHALGLARLPRSNLSVCCVYDTGMAYTITSYHTHTCDKKVVFNSLRFIFINSP